MMKRKSVTDVKREIAHEKLSAVLVGEGIPHARPAYRADIQHGIAVVKAVAARQDERGLSELLPRFPPAVTLRAVAAISVPRENIALALGDVAVIIFVIAADEKLLAAREKNREIRRAAGALHLLRVPLGQRREAVVPNDRVTVTIDCDDPSELRIPPEFLEEAEIPENAMLEVCVENGRVIVREAYDD